VVARVAFALDRRAGSKTHSVLGRRLDSINPTVVTCSLLAAAAILLILGHRNALYLLVQVCLFLVADLAAGKPVLPSAGPLNAWLGALGVALTAVYGFGVISRPMHTHARLGPDSILTLALFGLGIAGLFWVPPWAAVTASRLLAPTIGAWKPPTATCGC
jgi:CDP-diglyceride synthetase